jgi:alpha-beta hydrolase superfamily lysophospholipase
MRSHRTTFTLALTGISRMLLLRDWLVGWVPRPIEDKNTGHALVERRRIQSGRNSLDAVWVRPTAGPTRAVVLVCHGIGETVEHWLEVQELLAANGAASLVFDYSGYGRSSGHIDAEQCELDAIAAFAHLEALASGAPIAVLGFSLGSGIAAAVASRLRPSRLVLCAGFTSFRDAAHSLGLPRGLAHFIPPLWHVEEALRDCRMPVLVVHGEKDRLFPVRMATELAACCEAETIIVPLLGHAEPYHRPRADYWRPIIEWLEKPATPRPAKP